jgi:hypothetical protein
MSCRCLFLLLSIWSWSWIWAVLPPGASTLSLFLPRYVCGPHRSHTRFPSPPPPLLFHQFNLSPYLHHYATLRNSYSRAPYGPRPGTLQLIVRLYCLLHTPLFSFLCLRRLGWVGLGESFLFLSSLLRLLIISVLLSFDSRSLVSDTLRSPCVSPSPSPFLISPLAGLPPSRRQLTLSPLCFSVSCFLLLSPCMPFFWFLPLSYFVICIIQRTLHLHIHSYTSTLSTFHTLLFRFLFTTAGLVRSLRSNSSWPYPVRCVCGGSYAHIFIFIHYMYVCPPSNSFVLSHIFFLFRFLWASPHSPWSFNVPAGPFLVSLPRLRNLYIYNDGLPTHTPRVQENTKRIHNCRSENFYKIISSASGRARLSFEPVQIIIAKCRGVLLFRRGGVKMSIMSYEPTQW